MRRALAVSAVTAVVGLGLAVGLALVGLNYFPEGDEPPIALRTIQWLGGAMFLAGAGVALVVAAVAALEWIAAHRPRRTQRPT